MNYKRVIPARFIERPNRFIAIVEIDGVPQAVHVKNTGRCRELLLPNSLVLLSVSDNPARKTAYDLVAVYKKRKDLPPLLINIDSQIPNDAIHEWLPRSGLFSSHAMIRREVTYKNSRFDFFISDGDRRIFMEVKGVTLEENGIAMFPDAPTERGIKHIRELIACRKDGYAAYLLFVIQMKGIIKFSPNDLTHKEFGDALRLAALSDVNILAMDCEISEDSITVDQSVPIDLYDC